jgi:hypothetical protein
MRLERLEPGSGQPALGALFGGVLLAGAGLAAAWLRLGLPVPVCHLRAWTGIPCPGCGSTRLVAALLSGDVTAAAAHNPLVFGGLLAVLLWSVASAARLVLGLPPRRLVLSAAERTALRIGAALLLAAGWSYLLWRAA